MESKHLRRLKKIKRALRGNVRLSAGLLLLLIVFAVAALAGLLSTHDPYALGDDLLQPPSSAHWLGTDGLGRDVYSMILYGARTSLLVGIVAAMISAVIGVLAGGFSGYLGGRFDLIVSESINIFMMVPTFFLVLIIIALFGSSLLNVMVVIGLTSWPSNARLMRAQAMSLRERTFVRAAAAIGESRPQIVFRYIIPNGIFPVIANTTMGVGGAILTEASLSFLGLGDPNIISWGQMINQGRGYLISGWWVSTFSGLAVLLIVLLFYLIGDGANALISPKSSSKA
jgi:ABC-type dipeptide/oligopeptide/nickel transport systems, permease components